MFILAFVWIEWTKNKNLSRIFSTFTIIIIIIFTKKFKTTEKS